MTDLELYETAERAAAGAYAPYSGYRVGAALLTADGTVYTGANIENASYSAGVCAERVAAAKAVCDGRRTFAALAVAAPGADAVAWPCGICRQFLYEFGGELRIITGRSSDSITTASLDELLPQGFRL